MFPYLEENISLVICAPLPGKNISLVTCVPPTQEMHITSDVCFPTRETHNDICFPSNATHITSDMCPPTQEQVSLVICVPLPWNTYHL